MKNFKTLTYLFLLIFLFSCSGVENSREQNFTYPSRKNSPRLLFPMEAQSNGYSGTTRVFLFITDKGEVQQVGIEESSGFDILDEAAINYCKQLIFNPATQDGQAVSSRIVQKFRFNFIDRDFTGLGYVGEVHRLYKKESIAPPEEKRAIQNEILKKHREFLKEMDDAINFNIVIGKVVLPEVSSEWKDVWDHWPLSFLIYHDFLQRFPDNDSIEAVKTYLSSSIEADVQYIKTTPVYGVEAGNDKTELLDRIKAFVEKNYPEMRIDGLNMQEINS